ncbi:VanZ family protein [Pontibacter mangrovi]|uniref:VanZ family protein n=1 Tax=Pontibacter mangrovi TaxID=2589816 RepID=A0A501W3B9_9BACT|nr:VanZ family protein [Pontibacter mangrovi]
MLTTLLPSTSMPASLSLWELLSFDSFAHAGMFCVLCFLMIVGFSKQYTSLTLQRNPVRYSLLISTLFGVTIELLQYFLVYGRHGDVLDVIANTSGCLLGIVFFKWIYEW